MEPLRLQTEVEFSPQPLLSVRVEHFLNSILPTDSRLCSMQSLWARISQREINQDGFSKASEHSFLHIAEMLSRSRKVSKFASEIKIYVGKVLELAPRKGCFLWEKVMSQKRVCSPWKAQGPEGLPGLPIHTCLPLNHLHWAALGRRCWDLQLMDHYSSVATSRLSSDRNLCPTNWLMQRRVHVGFKVAVEVTAQVISSVLVSGLCSAFCPSVILSQSFLWTFLLTAAQ